MFTLSIIPVPITMDSDGNSTNNNLSELATAQQKVKGLEALYLTLVTGIIIEQDLYFNPIAGVNYGDQASVKLQLDSARAEVQQLITQGQSGTEDAADIQARLTEATARLPVADQRINDLTALLNAINSGKALTDTSGRPIIISGVNNTDAASVQKELDKAIAYKNELNNTQTFWQTILNSRMEANKLGDLNLDGQINTNDVTILQGAISGSIQLTDVQKKAADVNNDGNVDASDSQLLSLGVNPQTNLQVRLADTTTSITYNQQKISNLNLVVSNYTANEQKVNDLNLLLTQYSTIEQRINNLNSLLNAINSGQPLLDKDGNPITISSVNNSDPVAVQAEIDKELASLNQLKTTYGFLNSAGVQAEIDKTVATQNDLKTNYNFSDITTIKTELDKSTTYQKDLTNIQNFWQMMINSRPQTTSQQNSTASGSGTNITNTPPLWQFYTGDEVKLARLEDVKMMNDLVEQKAASEQKIIHLEGLLQSLKGEQSPLLSGEEKDKEIWSAQQDLSREKVRLDMLDGLLSNS